MKDAIRDEVPVEHIHTEDEVRFFHEGAGNFVMHVDGRVYDAHCTQGDLISVPANTQHWFDAGDAPELHRAARLHRHHRLDAALHRHRHGGALPGRGRLTRAVRLGHLPRQAAHSATLRTRWMPHISHC